MPDLRRTLKLTDEERFVYERRTAGMSIKEVMKDLDLTYTQVTNRYRKAMTKVAKQERLTLVTRKVRF